MCLQVLIYIGNQFCHNLFPSDEKLMLIMNKAKSDGMKITISFSYLRQELLPKTNSTIEVLYKWCRDNDQRIEIIVNDYGLFELLEAKKDMFDIVLIDSTDPMGPGTGLFTEEFYTNVKEALKPNGIMVAQSESPFADRKEIRAMYTLLRKVFPIVKPYVGPMVTYPAGYWSWAFCSVDVQPLDYIDEKRVEAIEKQAKLYNKEIHSSVFALPNFVKELTK